MEIVLLIIGLIIGCVLCYFVLQPKIKIANRRNDEIERENNELKIYNKDLSSQRLTLQNQVSKLTVMAENLLVKKQELMEDITALQQQAETSTQAIYDTSYQLMQEQFAQAAEHLATEYQELEEKYKNDYTKAMEESGTELAETLAQKLTELANVKTELAELRAKADAAIEAAKREEEKRLEIDKYKILVTDLDLLEINRLREIAPYFRNARAIYKIIWESYYRNLTNEMINRVIGAGTHTGIYKLTNTLNQKVYIGQAVNLSERWKEHIKCGLGIDTPANILYTAMLKDGVENFTFEVLEECERTQLNNRETYYIAFYRSQEHGYNMSRGGARQ